MKPGKLWTPILKRSVLNELSDVYKKDSPCFGIGIDAGGIRLSGKTVLTASAVREGNHILLAAYAVHNAVNNIYAGGGRPVGISVMLTLARDTEEVVLKQWIRVIEKTCKELSITVMSGHTGVSPSLSSSVVSVTAIGVKERQQTIQEDNLQNGYGIVMTKYAGMEGTLHFLERYKEELSKRYAKSFLDKEKEVLKSLSLQPEAKVLTEVFMEESMYFHDVSEGGIFGALWELGEYFRCGMTINLKSIPIKQVTIEICEYLDKNPYMLLSGGSLLIVTKQPERLTEVMEENRIPAQIIGTLTKDYDRILMNGEEIRYLEPFRGDTLYTL